MQKTTEFRKLRRYGRYSESSYWAEELGMAPVLCHDFIIKNFPECADMEEIRLRLRLLEHEDAPLIPGEILVVVDHCLYWGYGKQTSSPMEGTLYLEIEKWFLSLWDGDEDEDDDVEYVAVSVMEEDGTDNWEAIK